MDGILSQDEINALLNGMASGEELPQPEEKPAEPETSAEAALLQNAAVENTAPVMGDVLLTDVEKDAIGEVANISMGTSATTLYSLVNKKVNITTPVVSLATWEDLQTDKEKPCVFIQIKYTSGLDGNNILILKEQDVKVITDLMMGGDGMNTEGELGELHLSAISEAMNQMMGSSATSLSQMLGKTIDISPPVADLVNINKPEMEDKIADFLKGTFVKISFRMQIADLVDSTILQLYPIDFAREIVKTFLGGELHMDQPAEEEKPEPKVEAYVPPKVEQPQPQTAPDMGGQMPNMGVPNMGNNMPYGNGMQMNGGVPPYNPMNMNGAMQMPNMGMNGMPYNNGMPAMDPNMGANVNYQPAQFEAFNNNYNAIPNNENISLIMDVPLEVTVELGRTTKSISEILDFAPGTIIELDKIAGEPIDVLVNGKFVAKGEVVVIEESFGIRVTEIIK